MDNRKISLSIPGYRRPKILMETLAYPLEDSRINEVIITDDCSPDDEYKEIMESTWNLPKVRVVKNVRNWHNQHNKHNSISFAKNEWVVTLDNDNKIDKDFVDKLFEIDKWDSKTIYHPAWAAPTYNYRQFNGHTITKENVAKYCGINIVMTLFNTNNFLINKLEFLRIYQYNIDCRGGDGIFNNYNWLKAGNNIYVVPNLTYLHAVHPGSEFLREADSNMQLVYMYLDKISNLK